ncbi:hypothetical protein BZA77DRAFT_304049 [Pyronema omphalodes]|nr:hypothetical protein BZA77DRAFT_304049 [Pyronema omphalodes]
MSPIHRLSQAATVEPAAPVYPHGPRYTLTIFFNRALDLPPGDIPSFRSDPYIRATLTFPGTNLPKLHRRTVTIRNTREAVWNETWTVANIPCTGCKLKVKVLDEDPGDHDDHLGTIRIDIPATVGKQSIEKGLSMGRKNPWIGFLRYTVCGGGAKGTVQLDYEVTESTAEDNGRPYTIGPNWWSQHFSPLIGIITHTPAASSTSSNGDQPQLQRFEFVATKIQLSGPLPKELNTRYVAFRPIITTFYTKRGILGIILNRALKRQYRTVYSYDRNTTYGVAKNPNHDTPYPSNQLLTKEDNALDIATQVLNFTHWGEGGRVYTYIITLDGEWRFTETGKEFGIQMLSKHTMHSCVSTYVAFAGEFFIRKTTRHTEGTQRQRRGTASSGTANSGTTSTSATARKYSSASTTSAAGAIDPPEKKIEDYTLVIDNDSGTYRPPEENLPLLQQFLSKAIPGLRIEACHALDEHHLAEKKKHAEERERTGGRRRFKQPSSSRSSSEDSNGNRGGGFSSGDEEELQTGKLGRKRQLELKAWRKVEGVDREKVEGDRDGKGKGQVRDGGEEGLLSGRPN